MAISEDKERIFVTVSRDMGSRIDFYREQMGLSRSAFCGYLIGQGVMSMDKAMGIMTDMGRSMVEKAAAAVSDSIEKNGN